MLCNVSMFAANSMDGSEWKAALRLQIEALARRNELHRRCHRESVHARTVDMDSKIIRLRELVSTDANYAAQFYLECVCHADETERILNRTSSRDKKRRKPKVFRDTVSTISAHTIQSVPSTSAIVDLILPERSVSTQQPRWWEQLPIHRKEEEYVDGQDEVRHLWKTQTDFFLSCLGFMVGIGNMLRFPGKICEYGGLGWAFILAAIPVIIYHNIIITWSLQYLWFSALSVFISDPLPWEDRVVLDILSLTDYTHLSITLPERHIVLALATAWLLVYLGVCRGTTWMSWAIRFTATIPYLMMWSAAAEQVLFEIGVGVGAVFSLAAYSRFRNNVYRDAALLITMYGLNKFLSDVSSMLRVPRRSKAKWAHLRLQEKLMELFGPCGTFMRLSWALILMITHALSYQRPLFFGCHVPMESEFVAWILVHAPVIAAFIGAIAAIIKIRKSGKKISTLFDSSAWHQEVTMVFYDDSPPPTPSSRIQPKRENTYMETISLHQSASQPSFAASIASQGTLNLFGSPPVSNGFMISDSQTIRTTSKSTDTKSTEKKLSLVRTKPRPQFDLKRNPMYPSVVLPPASPLPREIHLDTLPRKCTRSEPPLKVRLSIFRLLIDDVTKNPFQINAGLDLIPSTPPPRVSPSRSEPPGLTTDRPAPSVRSRSESHDEFSDSDDEEGVGRQRVTVIRRFRSEDSVQAFSVESASNTPADIVRQRSLSSVAIFDDNEKGDARPTQTLSQLKRPPPIETPTRF
ncbi:Sodium:neurotransmitter symporter family protein [Ancylostoma ceylanicum]|uniref:Sodium:neurotransmitter symporter family protein n=1 Tax=Ancylostoma ceylanicum TaxID=53326 RepID=A0A0D6M862_9BILA|nr:Sodium:neurotransmitter symporter family protein [Ancylostoma ceylanicum]